jgi:hypothetical protein
MWIRILKVIESGSNPDPQQTFSKKIEKCTKKYFFPFIFLPLDPAPYPGSGFRIQIRIRNFIDANPIRIHNPIK